MWIVLCTVFGDRFGSASVLYHLLEFQGKVDVWFNGQQFLDCVWTVQYSVLGLELLLVPIRSLDF